MSLTVIDPHLHWEENLHHVYELAVVLLLHNTNKKYIYQYKKRAKLNFLSKLSYKYCFMWGVFQMSFYKIILLSCYTQIIGLLYGFETLGCIYIYIPTLTYNYTYFTICQNCSLVVNIVKLFFAKQILYSCVCVCFISTIYIYITVISELRK